MHQLKKKDNVSIVLVSHNEYTMREYAQKCIVINNGKMLFYGETEKAISFYTNKLIRERKTIDYIKGSFFNKGIIKKVTFKDGGGNQTNKIQTGKKVVIDFDYEAERKIKNPKLGISFYNSDGLFTGFWNSYENVKLPDISGKGKVRVTVDHFHLPVDSYRCAVVVCEEEESNVIEWIDLRKRLLVERPKNTRGLLKLKQTWEVIPR
jgi:ABC-type Fe3+/spermidine/putrescine transport system ATPase subunit